MAPQDVASRVRRATGDLQWRADPKPLHTAIDTILAENPNAAPIIAQQWIELAFRCGYLKKEQADDLDDRYDKILGQLVLMINASEKWTL